MKNERPIGPTLLRSACERSYEGFATISADVLASLNGPYGFPALFSYYEGQHTGYMNSYNGWQIQVGAQKRYTLALKNKLASLPGAAYDWVHAIEGVYKKGTPEYLALLPKGRIVFSKGKQTSRINAVAQLSLSLTGITGLAAIKTSVDTFLADLIAANTTQKESKATTEAKKKIMEDQRTNAIDSLLYVLAGLMQEYNNDVERVNEYFPMELMRPTMQTVFVGTLAGNSFKVIAKRTLKAGTMLTLKNPGIVAIEYYLADTKYGILPDGAIPTILTPGQILKVPAETLGNLTNKYLIVRNNTVGDAKWEVNL